ncbi:MAG: hypothetical protein WB767_11480 [Nocardioides sp.]
MTRVETPRADAATRLGRTAHPGRTRVLIAMAFLGPMLGLVASCGDSAAAEVTCGEFADMNDGDRRDVVQEILDASELQDEDFQDLEDLGQADDGLDQIAVGIDLECAESTMSTTLRTITSQ